MTIKNTHVSFLYILILLFFACTQPKQEKETEEVYDECATAEPDRVILNLLEVNQHKIAEGFTGALKGKFLQDTTRTQFLMYFHNGELYSYETFFFDGALELVKPIRCNTASGLMEYYYPDGKLKYTLEMNYGRKHGEGIEYYPSGEEHKLRYFTHDTLDGYTYEFSENGDTLLVEKFEMGNKITLP